MTIQGKIKKIQKGSALVYALISIVIITIILGGMLQFVIRQIQYGFRVEPREQSFHMAEAGVYFYRWYLAHNVEGKTATQVEAFWNGDPLGVDDNGDGDCDDADTADGDGDGTEAYVADYEGLGFYKICVTPPPEFSTIVSIDSTAWTNARPNIERTVRARLRKPSWSENAIVANASMRLSEDTEVYGPMHVNGGFHFDGIAHNEVTSSVSSYFDSDSDVWGWRPGVWAAVNPGSNNNVDSDDSEHFLVGKDYPVSAVDFDNIAADFNLMKSSAQADGLYWNNQGNGRFIELGQPTASQMRVTRVRRYNSSTYDITRLSNSDVDVVTIPDTGVVYVEDNIWIEGTLPAGKRLTVVAHDTSSGRTPRMFLGMDDIFYENYTSDTILGLAAEGDVELIRNSEGSLSAPSGSDLETLHIDAALLSQKGDVGRDHWSWNYKDTIEINGAIATNTRMGFGYTDGTGFANRTLIFDNNLLYYPPPLFPTGSTYAIDLWEEVE